ncbi:melatonin receptor type 1A-like [Oculina patagonica]
MNDTANEKLALLAQSLKNRESWLVGIESTVYIVLIATAFWGNILLSLAVYKVRTLRSSQNYFLVSLAATDILNAAVCMPLTLVALVQGTWPFGDFVCQLQGSLMAICASISLLTLGTIAINRYVKIVRSASLYRKIFSKRNVVISIVITWIITISFVTCAFSLSNTVFYYHPGKSLCFFNLSLADNIGLYISSLYAFVITVAFSTIVFSYYKVFKKIRAHFIQVANSSLYNDSSVAFAEEVKITTMLFATVVAFFICWSPSVIIDFYGQYHTLPRQAYVFNVFTYQSSSAINPLIYGLMKREFKEGYKTVLCCK